MKTYANKSNAKRAAIKAIVAERGVEEAEVKANADQYFAIEGDKDNGFYPHYKTERVGVSEEKEKQLKAEREFDEQYIEKFGTAHCPHCNVHLENGAWTFDEALEEHLDPKSSAFPEMFTHEFLCLGCGEEFGEERELPVKGEGIKIEKDRPEQNGIVRPSAGGKCRAIWDFCDELNEKGVMPMPKLLKEAAREKGWNENNAVIEMYQWRKFHGIVGRQNTSK